MDILEKQAVWREQKPLFEAEFIHSHLLPFFNFNENTGDYEIKSECVKNADDEDQKVAYETLNTGWVMWLRARRAKAQAVPDTYTPIVLALEDVQSKIAKTSFLTMDEENENEVMAVNANELAAYIDELIELQEPTND